MEVNSNTYQANFLLLHLCVNSLCIGLILLKINWLTDWLNLVSCLKQRSLLSVGTYNYCFYWHWKTTLRFSSSVRGRDVINIGNPLVPTNLRRYKVRHWADKSNSITIFFVEIQLKSNIYWKKNCFGSINYRFQPIHFNSLQSESIISSIRLDLYYCFIRRR